MAQLLPLGKQQYFDNNGIPLIGGQLWTYAAGTLNLLQTTSDAAGLIPNTNPIFLNGRGEATVFWAGNYDVTLMDAMGNLIWTVKNVDAPAPLSTQAAIGLLLYPQTAAETLAGVVPSNYAYPPGAIERYYTGPGDVSAALQNALNTNKRVFSFYGLATPFPIATYVLVPAGTTLENAAFLVTNAIPEYGAWAGDHQNQIIILAGNQAKARNLQINCGNFAAGGIAMRNTSHNDASNNEIFNGTQQGILAYCSLPGASGCTNFTINGNRIYYMFQGIQMTQQAGGVVSGNTVRVISGGGIWSAGSTNLTVTGNQISDCSDVGLDCEGGQNICYSGNSVRSCFNGEISWFLDGTNSGLQPLNVRISGNTAWHTATRQFWNGLIEASEPTGGGGCLYLTSATSGQRGIVFANNLCKADTGSCLLVNDLYGAAAPYDSGFVIDGNEFYATNGNASLHTVQRAWNIVVKNNIFHAMQGAEANTNQFKNCSNGVWDSNLYTYEVTPTVAYALWYYTDQAAAGMPTSPQITNNRFVNCGDNAFKHQPYNSGVGALLSGNLFTSGYTANGGCTVTADGVPILRGQKLYVTFSGTPTVTVGMNNVSALAGGQTYSIAKLACEGGGVFGANYSFAYASNGGAIVSRDGSGSGSGNPASTTRYATFAGVGVTVTAPAGALATGYLELDITTMNP